MPKERLDPSQRAKPKRIVVLASPPAQQLDIVGPVEVFGTTNRILAGRDGKRPPGYTIEVVTTGADLVVSGSSGLSILAHRRYRQLTGAVDTLLIAGGLGSYVNEDPAVLAWLRKTAARSRRFGSICTGAFLLARAGLLDGRRATTHWRWAGELAALRPRIEVDPSPIWVQDGTVYTSAGVTAGMDLALALVEEDYGGRVALAVARALVMFLRRPGGQAQFSVSLSAQASSRRPLVDLQAWMLENLNQNMSVESLAARSSMSPRNFARVFSREMGITPARYVEQLRLESARRLLEQTDKSLEEIAFDCGFDSSELMRRAFLRSVRVTPGRYRAHFREGTTSRNGGVSPPRSPGRSAIADQRVPS
jgi:transcriptional regulator GlxA family with amidase domain